MLSEGILFNVEFASSSREGKFEHNSLTFFPETVEFSKKFNLSWD